MAELQNNYSDVDFETLKRENGGRFAATVRSLNAIQSFKGKKVKITY